MSQKTRLELTWIGKDQRPKLEPRILIDESRASYHAATRREGDIFDNILIQGDNLLALRALEQEYARKVRCIFIDPPYNTGSAFEHYDDGIEHSLWLSLMRDRLELIRALLAPDGSLWITIDDTEAHYLKVLCDEIFGRANFVANVVWQKKSSAQPNAVWLSDSHDHVLVYAKNKQTWRPNRLPRSAKHNEIYKHSDEWDGLHPDGSWYGRGPWFPGDATASLRGGQRGAQYARTGTTPNIYPVTTPFGRVINPPAGTCWRFSRVRFDELLADHRITFGKAGNNRPCLKRFLSEMEDVGLVPMTTWHYSDVGENRVAAAEVKTFNPIDPFATPKPEALLQRILMLSTQPGDLVMDSFAGSGTTGAVAHKMGRRWIMVELGDHAQTHIVPRLKKVIDGQDPGGITEAVAWQGGGGFRFYRLAPSLLEKDRFGNWVIAKAYNPAMLAEAMCKLMGFTYEPSQEPAEYWQHGHSTERDFIYVTTQSLTHDAVKKLSEEVGPDRTLLVCCKAFSAKESAFANLTLKKIPQAVLTKCEWGRDDYSLRVANLPPAPEPQVVAVDEAPAKRKKAAASSGAVADLFAPSEGA